MTQPRQILLFFAIALALCLTPLCRAQGLDMGAPPPSIRADYVRCMQMAQRDPSNAVIKASELLMRNTLDGPALPPLDRFFLEHCIAHALFMEESYQHAGDIYVRLSENALVSTLALEAELNAQASSAYLLAGAWEDALAASVRARNLQPWVAEHYIDVAIVHQARGDGPSAKQSLDTALSLDPANAEVLVLLATLHNHAREHSRALELLNQAILHDPNYVAAYLERGIARRVMGNINGAYEDWHMVIALAPNSYAANMAQENLNSL